MKRKNAYYIFQIVIMLTGFILFAVSTSRITSYGIMIMLKQAATMGIVSLGAGFVITTGDVDFSMGALMSLSSVICSGLIIRNTPAAAAVFCSLTVCALCGMLNGLLAVKFSFPSAVITLAMAVIYSAAANIMRMPKTFSVEESGLAFLSGNMGMMANSFLLYLVLLTGSVFFMQNTYMGKYLVAIGDNESALKRLNIRTDRYRVLAFCLCGLLSGMGGVNMMVRVSGRLSGLNFPLIMRIYTVLALAGIGFFKVHRNFLFIIMGVAAVTVIQFSMTLLNVSTDGQNILVVLLFLLSVLVFDFLQYRETHRSEKNGKGGFL